MSDPLLSILIPCLNRPDNVEPVVASALAATPEAQVILIPTASYADEVEACLEAVGQFGVKRVTIYPMVAHETVGDYARKINTAVWWTESPYLFFGADDLRFEPGWFDQAFLRFDRDIGVVGVNDMGPWRPNSPSRNAVRDGEHATHCVVARWYCALGLIDDDPFPEQARVLNPDYPHEFVDDEFTATARARHAWAYAEDSHVEHLHPRFGKGQDDESYRRSVDRIPAGRAIYRARAHLWGEDPPRR